MEPRRGRVVYGLSSSVPLLVGAFLFWFLDLSVQKAMTFSLRFPNIFMEISGSLTFQATVVSLLADFAKFLLPFVPIAIGLGILALYGKEHGGDKELGLICTVPAAVLGCIISGFSIPSLFFYGGLALSGLIITGYGETYSRELDRWKNFRVGTSSLGKVFLILSILLTVGIFLHTASNIQHYKNQYKNQTSKIIGKLTSPKNLNVSTISEEDIMNQLPESYRTYLNSLPEQERKKILSRMKEKMGSSTREISMNSQELIKQRFLNSERFSSLIELILFLTVIAIGGVLLFFSKIVYGPVAGLVTLLGSLARGSSRE